VSDLDLDELIHTPEGRLVLEVLQSRRLPILIVIQDKGEMTFWYPPRVRENLENDNDVAMEWMRIVEDHLNQLRARATKQ
jgi:hypothetical protein